MLHNNSVETFEPQLQFISLLIESLDLHLLVAGYKPLHYTVHRQTAFTFRQIHHRRRMADDLRIKQSYFTIIALIVRQECCKHPFVQTNLVCG
ncbi:hypothetical protein D3C81_1887660 [compost metagenome]